LHGRANEVFLLPRARTVVRLRHAGKSDEWRRRLSSAVQVAFWLYNHGFPAVVPVSGLEQPVMVNGWITTFWRYVIADSSMPVPGTAHLGLLLQKLHRLPAPPVDLTPTNPLGSLLTDLARSGSLLSASQRDWLRAQSELVLAEYETTAQPLGCGLIHGDAHPGNLLAADGRYVLIDWDSVSYGPRIQDLVPTLVGVTRFGRPVANWVNLCNAYGIPTSVRYAPGTRLLCRARELRSLAAYIRASHHPDVLAELGKRLRTLIDGARETWRAS
jgi:Putative homoserine kinase type II (protein kinase fold)